jgi:Cft2 family RNA processing exonuclease
MAAQEGIGKTYTCLYQRTDGQAVCVDVKLCGTTEGIYQNSAILVLLHEYGHILGAYIMGISYYGTIIVIYLMPGSVRVCSITILAGFPQL